MSQEKYIGMDVHQATISVAVMDASGKLIMECLLETKAATIVEFIEGLHGTLWLTFKEGTSANPCQVGNWSVLFRSPPNRVGGPGRELVRWLRRGIRLSRRPRARCRSDRGQRRYRIAGAADALEICPDKLF